MNIVHLINVRWFNATAWYAFRLVESGIFNGDKAAVAGLYDSPVIKKAKELGVETLEAPFTSNNFSFGILYSAICSDEEVRQ